VIEGEEKTVRETIVSWEKRRAEVKKNPKKEKRQPTVGPLRGINGGVGSLQCEKKKRGMASVFVELDVSSSAGNKKKKAEKKKKEEKPPGCSSA